MGWSMKGHALPALVGVWFCAWASAAGAANFRVETTADGVDATPGDGVCAMVSGACSLRAAVQEANADAGADSIELPAGTYTLTLAGVDEYAAVGDIDILNNVSLIGDGAASTIVQAGASIGALGDRIFDLGSVGGYSPTVAMQGLSLRYGSNFGGAMRITGGSALTLRDAILHDNQSAQHGGALYQATGTAVSLERVTLRNNTAGSYGGALFSGGALTITDSRFDTNSAVDRGGAIALAAGSGASAVISGTAITRNIVAGTATSCGGGVNAEGGDTRLVNATISGNSAVLGGGICVPSDAANTLSLYNVTLSANNASGNSGFAAGNAGGGGLWHNGGSTAVVRLANTLVAGNSAALDGPDCNTTDTSASGGFARQIASLGYTLVGVATDCRIATTTGDQIASGTPGLLTLGDYGGNTETHGLDSTSSAIDGGNTAGCSDGNSATLTRDQRGYLRPTGSACDIGAFEYAAPGVVVVPVADLHTSESGGTASLAVRLATQPTANVTINLSSNDSTEGTVAPSSLTFTTVNWNTPQTVTVTGVDDAIADGAQNFTIVTAAATTTDVYYSGFNAADVSVTNGDNDSAGIGVSLLTAATTSELGAQARVSVVLLSQPVADVVIPIGVDNANEASADVAQLVFTAVNWNQAQTIVVTGSDEGVIDGDTTYHLVLGAAQSADDNYAGRDAVDVTLINRNITALHDRKRFGCSIGADGDDPLLPVLLLLALVGLARRAGYGDSAANTLAPMAICTAATANKVTSARS